MSSGERRDKTMRCIPRVTAFPWLVAVPACLSIPVRKPPRSDHGPAAEPAPGTARFDVLLPPVRGTDRPVPYACA